MVVGHVHVAPPQYPCWSCIKGRHNICTGSDEDGPCVCPIPHDGSRRRPEFNGGGYLDPGVEMEPRSWNEDA